MTASSAMVAVIIGQWTAGRLHGSMIFASTARSARPRPSLALEVEHRSGTVVQHSGTRLLDCQSLSCDKESVTQDRRVRMALARLHCSSCAPDGRPQSAYGQIALDND